VAKGTERRSVTKGQQERVLGNEIVKRLTEIVMLLEEDAGYPVDIEFAINASGKIFILQRRAITTLDSSSSNNGSSRETASAKRLIRLTEAKEFVPGTELVNIANPENEEESVPVYFVKNEGNVTTLAVDSKYLSLLESGKLASMLNERINSDPVVLKRLNSVLPLTAAVKTGEVGILPLYSEYEIAEKLQTDKPVSMKMIGKMLAAA
jgi:hypothetical protein